MQFATNHMGHLELALGLHHALAAAGSARIVSLSSSGHMQCPVLFDDLNFSFVRYPPWLAYGQSKTANVLFAVEAANRWAVDGITANAVMPGAIHTNLQRHVDWDEFVAERRALPGWRLKGSSRARRRRCSSRPRRCWRGVTGRYFDDCNEAPVVGSAARAAAYSTESRPTPSTRRTRTGAGSPPSTCSTRRRSPASRARASRRSGDRTDRRRRAYRFHHLHRGRP
jgi:NAD(P)-dependent dehydrogenase (short-subunit alcohol dehydrogenase family)